MSAMLFIVNLKSDNFFNWRPALFVHNVFQVLMCSSSYITTLCSVALNILESIPTAYSVLEALPPSLRRLIIIGKGSHQR